MNTRPILYDLGIAGIAVTLWLTPADLTRALGYTISLVFSSRAYYTGICLLSEERKADETATEQSQQRHVGYRDRAQKRLAANSRPWRNY